ncbi:MAG: matrixin family metalloprotease [Bryobacteraceae bacterium]|nr:matrixin family metalloprotease [Bryobacteraceae bacterium]
MQVTYFTLILALSASLPARAEAPVRLKSATVERSARPSSVRAAKPKAWNPNRRHVLVQFREGVSERELAALKSRGAAVVQAAPDHGVMVAISPGADLSDLNIRMARPLEPGEKLSRLLAARGGAEPLRFLVEYFPDTGAAEARAIASREGLRILENPDLLPHQLLVEGGARQMNALAQWDEVAYMFPASPEIEQGVPVVACAGAVTNAGPVGQYIAAVGPGWDGYGLNSADLTYTFGGFTQQLPQEQVKTELQRAMAEWARYVNVRFTAGANPNASRNVNFLFARGYHGDQYPFDGPGRVLAHTFYPAPPNPEPIAGDLHLDDDEIWRVGANTDLFSVALHELGHALGLGHADDPNAVMYPYYRQVTALSGADVAAIREVYSATAENPAVPPFQLLIDQPVAPASTDAEFIAISGRVSGGTAPIQVSWRTDRGFSGAATGAQQWLAAVPVSLGTNVITVIAKDARLLTSSKSVTVTRQPKNAPVTLQITSPAATGVYKTDQSTVFVRGTALPASAIGLVQWSSSSGYSGYANGTSSWTAGPVSLRPGVNRITITARAFSGQTASASIDVSYEQASTSQPGKDTTAPSLAITYPIGSNVLTSAASMVFLGTASDDVGVTAVTWANSSGASGQAAGTTYWNSGAIPLLIGDNVITIRAYDAAGNSGWRSVTVTRR